MTTYRRFALALVALTVLAPLPARAAVTYKISDLPIIASPSTNTFIEVADMNQVLASRSRKYLLTNLATVAQIPTLPASSVYVWTNVAGNVQLKALTSNDTLSLTANDGGGVGTIDLWTAGTKRWTVNNGGTLFPNSNYDIGTSLKPVQSLYLDGATGLLLNDRKVFASTGDPEGVRIAPVGSLFLRTDGGANTTLYTKATGASNTGWQALSSATGANIWANNAGVVEYAGGQTATNVLLVTSGLADNATNVAMVINTASSWTNGLLESIENHGVPVASIYPNGALVIGSNTVATAGYDPINNAGTMFMFASDEALGDPAYAEMLFQANNSTNGQWAHMDISGNSTRMLLAVEGWNPSHYVDIFYNSTLTDFPVGIDIENSTFLNPAAPNNGTVPYTFGSSIAHTTGNLTEVKNMGTNKFTVAFDGAITAGNPGGGSGAWKLGKVVTGVSVTLTITNYVEVMIDGVVRKLALVQ